MLGCAFSLFASISTGKVAWASAPAPGTAALSRDEWELFKTRFMTAEGRILDTGNGGVSHSEGQGWGLLFAVTFDDRPAFERILDWTDKNLRCRDDSLLAWRYIPWGRPRIPDRNNATDGDIFVAASLAQAATAWNCGPYAELARTMAHDILKRLVLQVGQRTLLLPGAYGFQTDDAVTINPSYYAFPALQQLAALEPSPVWAELQADGLAVIS